MEMEGQSIGVTASKPRSLIALLILALLMTGVSHSQKLISTGGDEETVHVQAVSGGSADLPCDITTAHHNDTVLLVVWYRDETPIYSWDVRNMLGEDGEEEVGDVVSGGDGAHWSGEGGERARWLPQQALLVLRPAGPSDRGEYRCRADFRASPTRNTRVHLDIIEAVVRAVISNGGDDTEIQGYAGPFREGDTPTLSCVAYGGNPPATVQWYRGGLLLESGPQASGRAQVRLAPLTRSDLLTKLTCHATNSPLLSPIVASVQIDMKLSPVSVDVSLSEGDALSAGRPQDVVCKVQGAKPPAKLSLWLDSQQLIGKQQDSIVDDSKSAEDSSGSGDGEEDRYTSTLTVTIRGNSSLHGQRVLCRAEHEMLSAPMERTLTLNVLFAPSVNLSLGAKLNPNDIEEGDDVYFECNVTANPPPYKQLWEHDGKPIQGDTKSGVTISNGNLVLRNVSRAAAGAYTCTASNVEGDARSQPVYLKVMYKPVCSTNLRRSYGVGRQERVQLVCEVEAVPPPDSFTWALNNSAQLLAVAAERYTFTKQPPMSVLTFTPLSDMDYGTALCWASNLVGRQVEPCALTLIPASRPQPPFNCTLANLTSTTLEVLCEEGWDGGLPQRFQLEVWELTEEEMRADILLTNISSGRPAFFVGGLQAGRALKLVLFAHNSRGRSATLSLEANTLEIAERIIDGESSGVEVAKIAGVCAGILLVLFLLALITVAALRIRTHSMHTNSHYSVNKHQKFTRSDQLQQQLHDDKNPDVVPLNSRKDDMNKVCGERETDSNLMASNPEVESSLPRPPPYSRISVMQPALPLNRVSREVVTTRAPLTQESDV